MQFDFKEKRNTIIKVAGGALIGLALAGLGGLAFYNYTINADLLDKIKAKDTELSRYVEESKKSGADLSTARNEATALQEKVAVLEREKQDLSDQIGAFAKQAASCDAIKKKLHVKD